MVWPTLGSTTAKGNSIRCVVRSAGRASRPRSVRRDDAVVRVEVEGAGVRRRICAHRLLRRVVAALVLDALVQGNPRAPVYRISHDLSQDCLQFIVGSISLRCFGAVGWAAGRASGLQKNRVMGCWRGYLSGARCRLAYGSADASVTHCLLLQ